VLRLSLLGGGSIDLAAGVDQETSRFGLDMVIIRGAGLAIGLKWVEKTTAGIALISTGSEIMANAAFSLDESICEELAVGRIRTKRLSSLSLLNITILPKLLENLLHNLRLLLGGCSAEDVEVNSEPIVDSLVKGVILGAKVGGRKSFLEGLCLGSSTVLVGTTNVDGVPASCSAIARKDIGGENTADDVAQMGNVVDVGKGTGN
jgi:hypothetical protein